MSQREQKTWEELTGRPARMIQTETGLPFVGYCGGGSETVDGIDDGIRRHADRLAARIPASANDNNPRWRGNLPVLHEVAKADPEGAFAVWAYGQQPTTSEDVHGDLNACFDGEDDPEEPFEFHAERLHEARPSIEDMFSDLLRVRVVSRRNADGDWSVTYRHAGPSTSPRHVGGDMIGLGDMRFNYHAEARRPPAGGLMVSYVDRTGQERQPFYDTSKARGSEPDFVRRRPTTTPAIAAPTKEAVCLSERTTQVLEMILAGFHKYEIGLALGYSRPYADRGAQRHIDAAVADAKVKFPAPPRRADNDNVMPLAA
jgi:hypothetical protein